MAAGSPGLVLWRITSARYADRAFDGEGARLYGGRWNWPGTPIVYCSGTLSLAALEYFVNVDPGFAPPALVAVSAHLPLEISMETFEVSMLPRSWRDYPAPEKLRDLGTAWARSIRTPVLRIPSAVIPHEQNYLLNPAHPDLAHLRPQPAEPFSFDPRMWK